MNWDSLLSGTVGVLIGAVVGPLVTAWIKARWDHRDSLRAVRGEIRANLSVMRAHATSTIGERDLETIPIALSLSTEVFDAMASLLATWGDGTVHQVALHYAWLRDLQVYVGAQGRAAVRYTSLDNLRVDSIPAYRTASALFVGACSTRDQAARLAEVALEWIDDELKRMREWDAPRPFDYSEASQ